MNPHSRTQRVHPHSQTQRLGQRPDAGARKTLRSLFTALAIAVIGVGIWRLDPLDKWSDVSKNIDLGGKAHNSAEALAARIKDQPDCRKYRAEILAQDGKKGEAAELRMAQAYKDAKNDHCLNIDIE